MPKKYLFSLSLMLLASCTVGPDYKRPEFFKDQQVSQALQLQPVKSEVSSEWYKSFNDEMLNRLIERSVTESPNVNVALEKLHQARQTLRINSREYFPMLDADGSYHYAKDSVVGSTKASTDYFQAGLDASWELDIWGAGRRLTESSQALMQAASANLDNVRLTLIAEVANTYFNLRGSQEQLRIAEQNLKLQSEIYELVKSKYDAGLADDITLNQSKYIVETTQSTIPSLQSSIETYQNALNTLVGQLPGELNEQLQNTKGNLVRRRFTFDISQLYDLPVTVLRNRPDVQISEQNLIAQNAKIGQAVAQLYPNVSISGFFGFQNANIAGLVDSDNNVYTYSPVISLPIFHWGQLTNTIELQESMTKEYYYLYQQSLLGAAAEVRNSMVAVEKEYNKNTSDRNAVKAQRQVAELTLDKYKQGLLEFSDVLTSQQNLLDSQNALISSNAQIYQNIVTFYKSVGGGRDAARDARSAQ